MPRRSKTLDELTHIEQVRRLLKDIGELLEQKREKGHMVTRNKVVENTLEALKSYIETDDYLTFIEKLSRRFVVSSEESADAALWDMLTKDSFQAASDVVDNENGLKAEIEAVGRHLDVIVKAYDENLSADDNELTALLSSVLRLVIFEKVKWKFAERTALKKG